MQARQDHGTYLTGLLRSLLRLAVMLALAWGVHLLIGWAKLETEGLGQASQMRLGLLVALLVIYALLIALPFVPGVEIGLMLMAMEGAWIAPFVYLATLAGLTLAYLMGALIPYRHLHRALADLRMHRASAALERMERLSPRKRLALMRARLPGWIGNHVIRHRYLVLALLVNLPGNALLGGGGGILMLSGFSRVFTLPAVLLTLALAVAPIPLLVWAFDLHWPF